MRSNVPLYVGIVALASICLALAVAVVLLATAPSHRSTGLPTITVIRGVPVGVRDTEAGALAAADNYVALAAQSVEQSPGEFRALVSEDYLPSTQQATLAEAAQLRAHDPADVRNYREGGAGLALIAARRLAAFTDVSASVTTWLGGIVWGPALSPRQTWSIVQTVLEWRAGRWQIASLQDTAAPAPVPATVYRQPEDDSAAVFDRALSGMSAPLYGGVEK